MFITCMPGWQISTKWSLACFRAECSPSVIPHWIRWVYTGIRQWMAVSQDRQTRKVLVGLGIKDLVNLWISSAVRRRDRNKEVSFSFWTKEVKFLGTQPRPRMSTVHNLVFLFYLPQDKGSQVPSRLPFEECWFQCCDWVPSLKGRARKAPSLESREEEYHGGMFCQLGLGILVPCPAQLKEQTWRQMDTMDRKLGLGGLGPLLEKTQPPPPQRRSLLNRLCLL